MNYSLFYLMKLSYFIFKYVTNKNKKKKFLTLYPKYLTKKIG